MLHPFTDSVPGFLSLVTHKLNICDSKRMIFVWFENAVVFGAWRNPQSTQLRHDMKKRLKQARDSHVLFMLDLLAVIIPIFAGELIKCLVPNR